MLLCSQANANPGQEWKDLVSFRFFGSQTAMRTLHDTIATPRAGRDDFGLTWRAAGYTWVHEPSPPALCALCFVVRRRTPTYTSRNNAHVECNARPRAVG